MLPPTLARRALQVQITVTVPAAKTTPLRIKGTFGGGWKTFGCGAPGTFTYPSFCGGRSASSWYGRLAEPETWHLRSPGRGGHQGWRRDRRNMAYLRGQTEGKEPLLDPLASSPPPAPLVVVVLGSTASGKSKLAIELAKHVGGEIISADSMQVYDGLDILTNKATEEEMQGIPHHMISVIDRTEKFDIVKFRDMALPLVEDILSQGKIPFIVGGTNYYIESLLWKVLIGETARNDESGDDEAMYIDHADFSDSTSKPKKAKNDSCSVTDTTTSSLPVLIFMKERQGEFSEPEVISKWSADELHQALNEVDPIRALKIHPNDTRKVVRSLQVFFRTGRKHSELIEEQCSYSSEEEDENKDSEAAKTPKSLNAKLGGPLRFPNAICLWIQAEREILNARIEDRVDQMVERGLRKELDSFVDRARQENRSWDFEEGQLQSIGVKEFQAYIEVTKEERETELGQKLFESGLDRLKIVTRQYAKKQVQWISQRFLKSSRRQLPRVYGLDGNKTDAESWDANVTSPAIKILNAHLKSQLDSPVLQEKLLPIVDDQGNAHDFVSRRCEICDKTLLGSLQYESHMKSAKHWKVVKRKKQRKQNEDKVNPPSLLKEITQ